MSRSNPSDSSRSVRLNQGFALSDSDLKAVLEPIHRHGPLPSRHLYEFRRLLPPHFRNSQMSQERLQRLSANGYLFRPEEQRATDRALNNYLIHDITRKGLHALQDAGLRRLHVPAHALGRQWMHDLMLSCFTASIELALLQRPRHSFVFHDEIVAPLDGKFSFSLSYEDQDGHRVARVLKPDRAFGIRYPNGTVRRFLVEADRGTEPNFAADRRRKSIDDNLYQYTEFIGEGLYKKALQVTGGVMVLYLMTSPGKMRNAICSLGHLTGGCNYIAFRAMDGFGHILKPPAPMPQLLREPFERALRDPFHLDD